MLIFNQSTCKNLQLKIKLCILCQNIYNKIDSLKIIKMPNRDRKVSFDVKLVQQTPSQKVVPQTNLEPQGMEIKQPLRIPAITLSGLSLSIISPLMIVAHFYTAHFAQLPFIQYLFVSLLVGFAINYIFILRTYELMPFLSQQKSDNQLKLACLFGLGGVLSALTWGWNGTGGLLFAILWEKTKGKKMGSFLYLYILIIIGSLMMEDGLSITKMIEVIPGILFGISNSLISELRESSTYILSHQFMFFISLCLPMFFPLNHIVVPSLLQWCVMIIGGISMFFTVIWTAKLMQGQRTSIVMALGSGIITIGISSYFTSAEYVSAVIILLGVILIIKKEFLDLQY